MFINVQQSTSDPLRYIPLAFQYSGEQSGSDSIPVSQIDNIYTMRPSGIMNLDFLYKYLPLRPAWILQTGPAAYTVSVNLLDIMMHKIGLLRRNTEAYITSDLPNEIRMPVIPRQQNAQTFIQLYEKRYIYNQPLDEEELKIYNRIMDSGETELDCYNLCKRRRGWIGDCMAKHDEILNQLIDAALSGDEITLESIDVVNINFPKWVG